MAPMECIASVDQGTTSTRVLVFARDGRVVGDERREHKQHFPQPGWVEHDAEEIMASVWACLEGAVAKARAAHGDNVVLRGVGVTNQRETSVVWDRATGKPLTRAIVWMDARTTDVVSEMAAGSELGKKRFVEQCGLPLTTYFSAVKWRWMAQHVPAVRDAVAAGSCMLGTIDSWIVYNLTGGAHITDVTNASRTMLMNIHTCEWDADVCAAFGLPPTLLPHIASSSEVYGHVARSDSLAAGVPVCGCIGDQHAALVGQMCFAPGEAKNTYGTGLFLLMNTGERAVRSDSGLLTTVAYKLGPDAPVVYALEGSVSVGGALVQWLRDNLGMIQSAADVETLASQVDSSGGVVVVPAFQGLFTPYWRDDARGVIVGLTGQTNKCHIARACLESVCMQSIEVLACMNAAVDTPLSLVRVDGGMTRNDLLMQMQADLLGVPVVRPGEVESTAWGAAIAAGIAVGVYADTADVAAAQAHAPTRTFTPTTTAEERAAALACWKDAVTRSFNLA